MQQVAFSPNSHSLDLRKQFPTFRYIDAVASHEEDQVVVTCHYALSSTLQFTHVVAFPGVTAARWDSLDQAVVQHWARQIGLAELFSYWKTTCSPTIVVEAGPVATSQLPFWNSLLQKGMSEFFFVNTIDGWQKDFVVWQVQEPTAAFPVDHAPHQERIMVPIGGGKDAVVTAELLKKSALPQTAVLVNPTKQVRALTEQLHLSEAITIQRTLDPQLGSLNMAGFLNGHVPFSAVLSFLLTFAAYLHDYRYVAVSNEASANEGNVVFLGQTINHQYSKSLDYETAFRAYCAAYLSPGVEYFSYLRPLHEIQIARLFAQYPKYWPYFLSCNRGQKLGKWCGECPKCLFVFIILSPFIPSEDLTKIWGKNLLEDQDLLPILEELTGLRECKSLECVGTRAETSAALWLVWQRDQENAPTLVKYAATHLFPQFSDLPGQAAVLQQQTLATHFIPASLYELLETALRQSQGGR